MQKVNTLNKGERLKSLTRIENIFKEGKSFLIFPFSVYYTIGSPFDNGCNQMMVSVSKHYFKHAVDRNRVKRLTREAYRVRKSLLQNLTEKKFSVAFVYKSRQISTYAAISAAMDTIIQKLSEIFKAA